MFHQTSPNATIHPSIEGLVAMIAEKKGATEGAAELRELCRRKIRSYHEVVYLKRYTTTIEVAAAKDRWQQVTAFANHEPRRAR